MAFHDRCSYRSQDGVNHQDFQSENYIIEIKRVLPYMTQLTRILTGSDQA